MQEILSFIYFSFLFIIYEPFINILLEYVARPLDKVCQQLNNQ